MRQHSVALVLEPPASLASSVRASLQLLAYPLASYVGFYAKVGVRCIPVWPVCVSMVASMLRWACAVFLPAQAAGMQVCLLLVRCKLS